MSDSPDQHLAGKYMSFRLATELYAIPVLAIQEIVRMLPVTRLPRNPCFVRGVISLRGKVMPAIDFGDSFGLGPTPTTEQTVILIVHAGDSGSLGLIVHEVLEVLDITPSMIRPTPTFAMAIGNDFVRSMAAQGARLLFLVDLERCLAHIAGLEEPRSDTHNPLLTSRENQERT